MTPLPHSRDGDRRAEFVGRVRRYAKRFGLLIRFDPDAGKGSHGTLRLGERRTTVKTSELGKHLVASMLDEVGIDKKEC